MSKKKVIIWSIILIPIVLAIIVAFATAPMGRKYANEHGEELIGRKLNIEKFRLNILTGNVSLKDVTIYEKNGTDVFASVEDIDLDLSMTDLFSGKIRVEDIDIDNPVLNVVQKGNSFNFDDIMDKLSEGESSEYTIDKFSLDDGVINYSDLTNASVPFTCTIKDFEIDIKNFNTSDHNHIEVEGTIGEDGDFEATYDGRLDDMDNMTVSFELEDLDLKDISPLFVQMFGREVTSGTLDLKSEITTVNGNVNGVNHLVIDEPKVEKVTGLTFAPEYKKVPLKTVLYVLTDKHDKCELDIKVKGNTTDPRFTYKGALMRALGKSFVKIVTSPFQRQENDEE